MSFLNWLSDNPGLGVLLILVVGGLVVVIIERIKK